MGSRNQFNLSVGLTFNVGFNFAFSAAVSVSMFLAGRTTIILGPDIKLETADYTVAAFKKTLEAVKTETYLVKALSKLFGVSKIAVSANSTGTNASSTGINAVNGGPNLSTNPVNVHLGQTHNP
jgi:hypothetical protein